VSVSMCWKGIDNEEGSTGSTGGRLEKENREIYFS